MATTAMDSKEDFNGVGFHPGRVIGRGIVLGLIVAVVMICTDTAPYISRLGAFEQVELNMSAEQAANLLRSSGISCDDLWISYRCTFDDYWRVFRITFADSQADHPVIRKTLAYKRDNNSFVSRILRFIHV
jgi:hypothetical protein